jgi:1-deoxy-D-xylulose-5-phosphate reductoisomerase
LILLGSTGSIGVNTLEIAKRFSLHVEVLVAGRNITLLNQQLKEHKPLHVIVQNEEDISKVEHKNVSYGMDAILNAIESSKSSLVVNALVGFVGLRPTLKAIECGKQIALANKESLVAGGAFVDTTNIQPIDSEHFGLWYLLQERAHKKMIITASGGAFRDWDIERLKDASLADTQKHPNWSMGQKITIDSATMANKLFELLEARWLFGAGEYDAIIETKSLIHALIDFKDGSTTAHIAKAHMQLPIAYALDVEIDEPILDSVDLVGIGNLEFREIEKERYNIWHIKEDVLKNPHKGVIVNAANEASIEQFIAGKISFLDISKNILNAYEKFDVKASNIEDIFAIDKEVRAYVRG